MPRILRRLLLRATPALLALTLLAQSGTADTFADATEKVHPAVQVFSEQHPGARIPVIVQTAGSAQALMDQIGSDAAAQELEMIGGVAAMLTPEELERLGRDPAVEWVSLDAVMLSADREQSEGDASDLASTYPFAANAVPVWEAGITGQGVTVAVIDSGIIPRKDFQGRIAGAYGFSSLSPHPFDQNGHGTYVAGIVAGEADEYTGIAPDAVILSLKVSGREGYAVASDVINALQWVVDHKDGYGIRVVNLSLTSSIADSYRQDPLDAAVEQAWFHGIVVVTAAGNFGGESFAVDHPPANDPYVITVGAFDDQGTRDDRDDTGAPWSSGGVTVDGHLKPEVMAPGVNVVSTLASSGAYLAQNGGEVVDKQYLRLSGTSASAAIVSGVVALMLQDDAGLTPDQVKFRLMTSGQAWDGTGAVRVDAYAAVLSDLPGEANQGAVVNDLIDPETGDIMYDSVLWRSVLWRSVLWRSVLWSSVLWRN